MDPLVLNIRRKTAGMYPSVSVLKGNVSVLSELAKLKDVEVGYERILKPPIATTNGNYSKISEEFKDNYIGKSKDTWQHGDNVINYYTEVQRVSGKGFDKKTGKVSDLSYVDIWERGLIDKMSKGKIRDEENVTEILYLSDVPVPRPAYITCSRELIRCLKEIFFHKKDDEGQPPSILDIAAYGERMIASAMEGVDYVGIDPNPDLILPHRQIISDCSYLFSGTILSSFCSTIEGFMTAVRFDGVLLSIPPFDTETYRGNGVTSTYPNADCWFEGFITEAANKSFELLNEGGILAITILDREKSGFSYTAKSISRIKECGFTPVGTFSLSSTTPWWILRKTKEKTYPPLVLRDHSFYWYVRNMVVTYFSLLEKMLSDDGVIPYRNLESSFEGVFSLATSKEETERFLRWLIHTKAYLRAEASFVSSKGRLDDGVFVDNIDVQGFLINTCLHYGGIHSYSAGPRKISGRSDEFNHRIEYVLSPSKINLPKEYVRCYLMKYLVEKYSIEGIDRFIMSRQLHQSKDHDPIFVDITEEDVGISREEKRSSDSTVIIIKTRDTVASFVREYNKLKGQVSQVPEKSTVIGTELIRSENRTLKDFESYHLISNPVLRAVMLRYSALSSHGHQYTRTPERNSVLSSVFNRRTPYPMVDCFASIFNKGTPAYFSVFPDIEYGSLGVFEASKMIEGGYYMINPPDSEGKDVELVKQLLARVDQLKIIAIAFGTTVWDDQNGTNMVIEEFKKSKHIKAVYVLDSDRFKPVDAQGNVHKQREKVESYGIIISKGVEPDMDALKQLGKIVYLPPA